MTRPLIQAIVLADHITRDHSGKLHIIGTFRSLWADHYPSQFSRPLFAYLSVTEVTGNQTIALQFVDLSTNEVLLKCDIPISSNSPLDGHEIVIQIPPLPLPRAGAYAFEVTHDEIALGSLRLIAMNRVSNQADDDKGENR